VDPPERGQHRVGLRHSGAQVREGRGGGAGCGKGLGQGAGAGVWLCCGWAPRSAARAPPAAAAPRWPAGTPS
jgi:hypothetical protein